VGYFDTKIAWSSRMTPMSECCGWLQLDSKSFHVVQTCAPWADCLPSEVVTIQSLAATTQ
jgi:hypothetical protein